MDLEDFLSFSLVDQLDYICNQWIGQPTDQSSGSFAAYSILLEVLGAYSISKMQIDTYLAPKLVQTRSMQIRDVQDLEEVVIQRLKTAQEGTRLKHWEIDNALRCAYAIAETQRLLPGKTEEQIKVTIEPYFVHLEFLDLTR